MKQIILTIALIFGLSATAQDYTMKVYKNGVVKHAIPIAELDSVTIGKNVTGTIDGHEYVDLGLPSGTKWATCNVGATIPEDYGGHYAWGEIVTKEKYNISTSTTFGKSIEEFAGNATYDVASAEWGGVWRMPTGAEIDELVNNCTWEYIKLNQVIGFKGTGPNGNWVFFPAAGTKTTSTSDNLDIQGDYWSSTPTDSDNEKAQCLYLYATNTYSSGIRQIDVKYFSSSRQNGYSIRPVTK